MNRGFVISDLTKERDQVRADLEDARRQLVAQAALIAQLATRADELSRELELHKRCESTEPNLHVRCMRYANDRHVEHVHDQLDAHGSVISSVTWGDQD